MELKRTGWETWDRGSFMEVLPQDDLKEHWLGDECWCNPRLEEVEGGMPNIMIVHSSADQRELSETDDKQKKT